VAPTFHSILFEGEGDESPDGTPSPGEASAANEESPETFADLHLDEVATAISAGQGNDHLGPLLRTPLRTPEAIAYRHEVFRDLEDERVLGAARAFGQQMETIRGRLAHAARTTYDLDRQRWLLNAAEAYGAAVTDLADRLGRATLRSRALAAVRDELAAYVASEAFTTLVGDTERMQATIRSVSYRLRISGSKVTVTRFRPEPDYGAEVLETFAKFRQGDRAGYHWPLNSGSDLNHVEAAILNCVARLHPQVFAELATYAAHHADVPDPGVEQLDRELRFYLAWLEHIDPMRRAGLAFCLPDISDRGVEARGVFDVALAAGLVRSGGSVVVNDVELAGPERIIVVTGPNQGGKTTYARTIGQLAHLARLGVPVPGERVRLPIVDRVHTHFERQERVEDLSSKLEDDLRRIHVILEQATPSSLLVMNESFSSTTVDDQLFIGREVLQQVIDRGLICVVVTFLDELATLDPSIVSMVSSVDPQDDALRTFRIVRRAPDGLAHALAIAARHRLTYADVTERLGR
jgi:DNA mismatch repair protein MutS